MKTSSQRTYAISNHCSQAISYLSILASVRWFCIVLTVSKVNNSGNLREDEVDNREISKKKHR